MKEVNVEELNQITNKDELTVIKFWAEWCQPCKAVQPIINEAEQRYENVNFVSVDIENPDNDPILKDHLIMGVPTMAMMKAGEKVDKMVGVPMKQKFFDTIEKHV